MDIPTNFTPKSKHFQLTDFSETASFTLERFSVIFGLYNPLLIQGVPHTVAKLANGYYKSYPSLWLLISGLNSHYLPLFPLFKKYSVPGSNVIENGYRVL